MESDLRAEYLDISSRQAISNANEDSDQNLNSNPCESSYHYAEPRPDHHYRFQAQTRTVPHTQNGVHEIEDKQEVVETEAYLHMDYVKTLDRTVRVRQTIDSSTVGFTICIKREKRVHGTGNTEMLVDETINFAYDMANAMSNISGWVDTLSQPSQVPAPPRPLSIMQSPPSREPRNSPTLMKPQNRSSTTRSARDLSRSESEATHRHTGRGEKAKRRPIFEISDEDL